MKIFLAIPNSASFFEVAKNLNVENVLISHAFFKKNGSYEKIANNWFPENLIIDSGAFSVWSKNEKIDIDKYLDFCLSLKKSVPKTCSLYFVNLDVIPGNFGRKPTQKERENSAQQGWDNMLYLEKKGLKVIPVFHQHEDFKWLKKLMSHTDYIGISPANDSSTKSKDNWMCNVFKLTRDKIKTHGFAVTGYTQLIKFPFYSADSSSWAAGIRFGRTSVMQNGKFKSFKFKNQNELLKYWNNLETKSTDLCSDYRLLTEQGMQAFLDLEKFINQLWEKRGIKWDKK